MGFRSRWVDRIGSSTLVSCPACLMLLLLALGTAGCNVLGAAAGASPARPVRVDPVYEGLSNQRVAVMVAADPSLEARQSEAIEQIVLLTSLEIQANVENVTIADPVRVRRFMQRNPNWSATSYQRIAQLLEVDRIVLIDITTFDFQDPRNRELWMGTARTHVGVIERENAGTRNLAIRVPVTATFPEGRGFGTVEGNQRDMAAGLARVLARDVARLFYAHRREGQ